MNLSSTIDDVPVLIANAMIAVLALLLAFALPDFAQGFFQKVQRWGGLVARRQWLAVFLVGISAPLIRLALLPLVPIPHPALHDEYSYMLGAETFAAGRLTNPTPPLWVHFESFYVDLQPTYMSMYPPAQSLVMAAGMVLFRNPWFGICLSVGAMCAGICWMLQGWFSPGWALYGSLLVVLRIGVFSYWMNSYWGGAVPAFAGALVLGALPRLWRQVRVGTSLALALGIALFLNSRPFEGVLLTAIVAGALLVWMFGKQRPPIAVVLKRLALPAGALLLVTAGAMAYYNWRVFGSPTTIPYQVNRATYAVSPYFLWQTPRPEPVYHHDVLRKLFVSYELPLFLKAKTPSGFVGVLGIRVLTVAFFFLGPILLLPLLSLPSAVRTRRRRFLMVASALFFIGLMGCAFVRPHYLAPATALIFGIVVEASRRLRQWRPGGQAVGASLVRVIPCMCVALLAVQVAWTVAHPPVDRSRTQVQSFLAKQPGPQLAIVHYTAAHDIFNEWVYNGADIPGSQVIWARDMGAAANQKLLDAYRDRKVWLVEPDQVPAKVSPYVAEGYPHVAEGPLSFARP